MPGIISLAVDSTPAGTFLYPYYDIYHYCFTNSCSLDNDDTTGNKFDDFGFRRPGS